LSTDASKGAKPQYSSNTVRKKKSQLTSPRQPEGEKARPAKSHLAKNSEGRNETPARKLKHYLRDRQKWRDLVVTPHVKQGRIQDFVKGVCVRIFIIITKYTENSFLQR
jgi:hypothetical protein